MKEKPILTQVLELAERIVREGVAAGDEVHLVALADSVLTWHGEFDRVVHERARLSQARKELSRRLRATQWQPIATAPTEGDVLVLLHSPKWTQPGHVGWYETGSWLGPFWTWRGGDSETYQRAHQPTHWMPIPHAPAGEG